MHFKRVLALLLVLMLVFVCGACKKASYSYSYYEEDDFAEADASDNGDNDSDNAETDGAFSDKSTQSDTTQNSNLGSAQNPDNSSKLPRDKVMSAMPSSLKNTTLTYMYWHDAKTQMEKEAIEGFENATGITVQTVVASYNDFQSELNTRIASGNAPDLVRQLGNQQWMVKNLQPITNSGFDFSEDAWDKWIMKQYTFNGKCYAVNLKDSAILDVAVLYYNKKALKAADMDGNDPYKIWKANPSNWTWDKFWSMCDDFVKANGGKSEYYGATFAYYEAYIRAIGGANFYYDADKGKYVNNSTSQATINGWKKTLEAYEKQWLKTDYDATSFERNRILFNWFGPFGARTKDATFKSLKDSGDLGVVALPTDSANNTLYELTAFGIPVGAKNAAAAPYYIRYVMDKNSYDWNKVYCSKEAQDVLDTVTAAGNFFYGHGEIAALRSALLAGGASQVNSILNSYSGTIDDTVEQENINMVSLPQ